MNAQLYVVELADALGVERPRPAGTGYQFEFPVKVGNRDGTESPNFISIHQEGHFILEAKYEESANALMQKTFGPPRPQHTPRHTPACLSACGPCACHLLRSEFESLSAH